MSALMIQGVSSGAGKSLLTTALARVFRRRGIDVVPFKAINISNNARVVEGGEIGTAQFLQALAAGVEPEVRMNPVLIKPESGSRSEVVVLGKRDAGLTDMPWTERGARLWLVIEQSLRALADEHAVILLEGAGSPAEPNLRDSDLANMRTANAVDARVLLVADIDRGGAFAHLYGTWGLVRADERTLFAGFILNKFHGDPSLLRQATEELERSTGVPTIGILPWLDHGLPDEDGAATPTSSFHHETVAVVRYPTSSNLDEFKRMEEVARVRWATRPGDIDDADLVILPGSKHVAADLDWLTANGLREALHARARAGRRILGICGGMQMLGELVEDEAGSGATREGLGLLPLRTSFATTKRTVAQTARFHPLNGAWSVLSGRVIRGYQIRRGVTTTTAPATEAIPGALGYVAGGVMGVYLHGLFEDPPILEALFNRRPTRSLDHCIDQLADAVETHVDVAAVVKAAGAA